MRRAPFVIAGTIVGTAAVLAFPVEATHAESLGPGDVDEGVSGTSTPTTSPASPAAVVDDIDIPVDDHPVVDVQDR